jgi:EAL domain-containing protein (putative c-di-GMP-specific phosphodiesterase class I)
LSVAVNLSAAQFKEPRLDRVVGHVLDETGLKPHQLELELTETMVMRDGERTAELLARLHGLGVKLSIDDFGTGYSSLSYLKRFPLSGLKIDRSFVRDMAVDHDDAMIVAAIIALARSLRLKVVAEGVEEAEQIRLLAAQGCDELQGFFFTPPLPAAEFERWVFERLRPAPGRGEEDTSLCPLQASGSRLQAIRNAEA